MPYYFIIMPLHQPKQEDPDYDELIDDDEDDVDEEYQSVDEETGFYIPDPLHRPITSPMSCHDIYNQIQEGLFSVKKIPRGAVLTTRLFNTGIISCRLLFI